MLFLILKFLLPILLKELVSSGLMTKLEAEGIETLGDFYSWIRTLKTYNEFPERDKDQTHNFNRQPS